jgi:PAS domain S-box-containing protein
VRRSFRIRTYLLLLVLVSAVPFIAFAAVLARHTATDQTRGFARDVTAVARALSLAMDNQAVLYRTALEALGRSPALARGDLAAFHIEMQAAAALLNGPVSLSRSDGEQVLNSRRPAGTVLPRRSQVAQAVQAALTGQAWVSDLIRGAVTGQMQVTVNVPVPAPGVQPAGPPWVLAIALPLERVEAMLRSQRLPPDWIGAVVDRGGLFLARTLDNDARLGTPASMDWSIPARTQPEGWVMSTTLEGVVTYTGFVHSDTTGWTVGIGVPEVVVRAPLLRTLLPLAGFGTVLTLLAAAAALAVARRIARPISALARRDAALEELNLVEAQQVAAALRAADTDRRAAEAALRESEAELLAAREVSPQAHWTADPAGKLVTVSHRVSEATSTAAKARLGDGWLNVVHPDDRVAAQAAWAHAIRTGQAYDTTFRVHDRPGPSGEGPWRWMRARAAPHLGADGRPTRWYGTTEDVDDRLRAQKALEVSESRLRQLTEDLEARVAAEVQAREAAQAALHQSQRMEALGKLASGIAHDFNNVLQAVGGSLSLILRAPGNAARVERVAGMARDAVDRGAAITGRMLSLARRADLRAGPVDSAELLKGLRLVLQHTLGAGIRVDVDVPPDLPPLLADRGQLETVLINLATNARDAMPRGGTLRLAARTEGGQMLIEAADTGAGMTPDVLIRAREPFFTTKPPGAGTGLGLAMAHGFAEQSGGLLRISSTPGEGTVVSLVLPLAAAALAPAVAVQVD